ncbi:hypothetical protein BDF20DRAFT_291414 [Mycotypha africana]|uniref:uncharacterized protein n=1 Tax=Mycotypha africana TaxID=64632 RepID=UPI002300F985|nr:uncharacterized protein BDF20DRAFT_291414 [Mycotypha africana]KAI8987824.1 hypothetical protein BDF20DRAFT_291414 [Mycotypha africana]
MEDQKMVAAAADLYRQIEELENQITVTRERNTHVEHELHETNHTNLTLWQLIQKQDMMIRYLEEKQIETENHITQGIEQLAVERQELGELLDTLESKIKHGDQKINKAIDKMTLVTAIMLKEEDHAILKKRTEELENQVMTLDNIVEQLQLTADIDLVGTASAQQQQQQQASRIKELEAALVNSNEQVKDYSRVKQSLEMLQEEYNMLQKRKRPSFYRTSRIGKYHQVLDWMDENMRDKPEIIEEVANMVYDVSEMTNIIHNLNDQLCIERQQTKERLKLLEADILNLTVMNHHLQQQKKPCESLSRMESGRRSLSPAHTAQSNNLSKVDENQRISSATNLSELSSTVPSRTQPLPPRSHTMSSNTQPQVMEPLPIQPRYTPLSPRLMPRPSPPLNPPPRQPLPQTPAPPPPIHDFEQIIKNYQQKLIIAENENHVHQQTIRALEEKLTTVSTQRRQSLENLKYLIDSERKQKLKAVGTTATNKKEKISLLLDLFSLLTNILHRINCIYFHN